MKKIIFLAGLISSVSFQAQSSPDAAHYNCEKTGCAVACLNGRNKWSTLSGGADKVSIKYYSSGNIEYLLTKGQKQEIVFIGIERMQCKLSGIKSNPATMN